MQQANIEISRDDYLEQDVQSELKLEFYDGQIFAMAGGTFKHAQIAGNVYGELRQALNGKPCRPMNSDMRVHTPSGLDTYPDISVYCGEPELGDNETTLLNPTVIIEVLSPSTRDYDRGGKFAHYRSIVGLQDYLLVDPTAVLVEHFRRVAQDEWLLHVYSDLTSVVVLESLDMSLFLESIYHS
jgi:Uma2 family endonuclease